MPGDLTRVFFSDSGSVAVEVAMKMAIQFWRNQGRSARRKFMAFRGRLSWRHHRSDVDLPISKQNAQGVSRHCCRNIMSFDLPRDEESAGVFTRSLEQYAEELAGIVVEPLVQGRGGMRFHDPAVLRLLPQRGRPL